MTKPVQTTNFWHHRMLDTLARGRDLHTIVYDTDPMTWERIQNETYGILQRYLNTGMRVLDAGCGYGAIYDVWCQGLTQIKVEYTGIDLSPDFIDIGKMRHPSIDLSVGDLRSLPYSNKHFHYVVCRSVKAMIEENEGDDEWNSIYKELRRVGVRILFLEYDNLPYHRIVNKDGSVQEKVK